MEAMPSCRWMVTWVWIFVLFALRLLLLVKTLEISLQPVVNGGTWEMLIENGGVSAMHMTLTPANTVIMFDRTDYGPSQLKLPNGRCRNDSNDLALKIDCYAHSIELDLAAGTIRPLEVLTDTWCSSASFVANGTLVSTGGYNDGSQAIRYFVPCSDASCDWFESSEKLAAKRWYASNQILPDNRIIVVGGRRSFSYEFAPKNPGEGLYTLPFLYQTNVRNVENNLYPFLHLSSDGHLFIFCNRQSILFDYTSNRVVKTFPSIPDGGRNYPSSGSSVMLPLSAADNFERVEILICGGAPDGSYQLVTTQNTYMDALQSCGRMVITDPDPSWEMEDMPSPRVMGDMLILPTGEIIIINGAQQGTAGWTSAREPVVYPFLYTPDGEPGQRFQVLAGTAIPRMYHSTANVLPDGRVLVGGSNPNVGYVFTEVPFQTELRLEAYLPYYLDSSFDSLRPTITSLSSKTIGYASNFTGQISIPTIPSDQLEFRLYAPPFTTHSFSMNQRQLVLVAWPPFMLNTEFSVTINAPPSSVVAPAGYYLLFAVNAGIPSEGVWVQIF